MEDKILAAIAGLVAGIITTYLGAILKFRDDLRARYDNDLREKRIDEYRGLWRLTEMFPKYARTKPVLMQDIRRLTGNLRDWYFQRGGMFLSGASRDAYFEFQEKLKAVLDERRPDETPLEEPVYERLRKVGSDLRSTLVRDVLTRKESELNEASNPRKGP
jgi:hypothetical protein